MKWIGNKQRFAREIASYFPVKFGTYFEPFLGSGAVLGTLAPKSAIASDCFRPLIEIWQALSSEPEALVRWYTERWIQSVELGKKQVYESVRQAYNCRPNGADLVFLCRACYGGVVRFRKADGHMSTPCGIHRPVSPDSFANRVAEWHRRTVGTEFLRMEYQEALEMAKPGDLIYCDPPYTHSQAILYGAQSFSLAELFKAIEHCKRRGVFVAVSIDGSKRSGNHVCDLPIPDSLFEREVFVDCGRSMLKRFQMNGKTLEHEVVSDRLLLTY
ncbi:MAG: Dam family site-specific DNA-(adenine-N6)-methyltransferase [Pirellulales bacterium]|nr:Dam family site-specific DNA-(adenine-N6)-methyltransferase [Pirellulales bacterium]